MRARILPPDEMRTEVWWLVTGELNKRGITDICAIERAVDYVMVQAGYDAEGGCDGLEE